MPYRVEIESANNVRKGLEVSNYVKITDTLQGCIWRAELAANELKGSKTVVIKVANASLHEKSIAIVNDKIIRVKENILLEQSILKYLTEQPDCSPFIAKFISFTKRRNSYHLVMEDGGSSLFDFVIACHRFIREKKIDIYHWKQVTRIIFKQMIECLDYIHSKKVCHNDISLENFLINDVAVKEDKTGKIKFVTSDIRIKLCDFGLAELYQNNQCLSNKHCGKKNYKSPEVIVKKKRYSAKKNDVWCAGVCLFMVAFSCRPWDEARVGDGSFVRIVGGRMTQLLNMWDLSEYIDAQLVDLLQSIFKCEESRINVNDIKKHQFFDKSM